MTEIAELQEIRKKIDALDDDLVQLLVKRIRLAMRASDYKHTAEDVKGCDRVQIVLDSVGKRATQAGGYEETVQNIYRTIISELTDLQLKKKEF